jgi:positive regulator of sigma E activity
MKRIEHVGTVVRIQGADALVELKPSERCGASFRCACCSSVRPEPRTLKVGRSDLEQGDVVCVSIPAYAGYVSTLAVFVLPIVLMIGGAIVGWLVEGKTASHDLPIIIGGVCGFALAVVVAAFINRRMTTPGGLQVRRLKQDQP